MSTHYKYASLLASGRQNNEDRALVIEHGDDVVLVVADGAGGMRGGAAASDAVVLAVTTALADTSFDVQDGDSWARLLGAVDLNLSRTMAGETTVVVVVLTPDGLLGVSAGDSQAWVITPTDIDDLTAGQNKRRLGSGRAARVLFSRPALDGTLLVASDGLFNYLSAENIARAVRWRHPDDVAERLRAAVQLPSGKYADDLGLVVVSA